ncbi:hypothetical protein DNTS_033330, partial [Danionella cerebrum]
TTIQPGKAQQFSLGKKQEPLIQDVPTRWNSTLDMVKHLSRNKEAAIAALDNQEHKLVLPTAAKWDKLQKLETLLEPCRQFSVRVKVYVTELLGGEAYVSCSVVLPSLCHLCLKMEACDEDPAYVVRFKTKFKEDLASLQPGTDDQNRKEKQIQHELHAHRILRRTLAALRVTFPGAAV